MGEQDHTKTSKSPYIGVPEVAERLQVSERAVYELTRTSAIPHRRLQGTRRCLFLVDELEQWEAGAELQVIEPPRGGRVVRPIGTRPVRAPSKDRMAATILAA